jgi:hypothetical protein
MVHQDRVEQTSIKFKSQLNFKFKCQFHEYFKQLSLNWHLNLIKVFATVLDAKHILLQNYVREINPDYYLYL